MELQPDGTLPSRQRDEPFPGEMDAAKPQSELMEDIAVGMKALIRFDARLERQATTPYPPFHRLPFVFEVPSYNDHNSAANGDRVCPTGGYPRCLLALQLTIQWPAIPAGVAIGHLPQPFGLRPGGFNSASRPIRDLRPA